MENTIENCAIEFKGSKQISKTQADNLKQSYKKVSSVEFWSYVDSLNIIGFRDEIEKILSKN